MKFIRNNIDRIFLALVLLVLVILLVFYAFDTLKRKKEVPEAKKIDEITEYSYYLHEDDSDLYGSIFTSLKNVLASGQVDYDEYARYLSSLFVIDFYTLNNKVTNMDIGGVQYISSHIKDNFVLKASDTIYKNVKSNIYGDRNQELPIVNNVSINSITNVSFSYGDIKDNDAYEVVVLISYEKDLDYPEKVILTLVHENNKLTVVEVK